MNNDWLSRVRIRHAGFDDLQALEWGGKYTHFRKLYREIFESSLRDEAILWIADLLDVGLVGQLFVQLESARKDLADGETSAYIYGFRVKDEYRGLGLGSRLLQSAEYDLIKRGYRIINLNVNRDNPDARRLYERRGYYVVGAEAGRWSYRDHLGRLIHVNEPAWQMQKRLSKVHDVKILLE